MAEIAVVGAGLMGHGIALVLALGGHAVRLTDSRAETLDAVPALMASALATLGEASAAPDGWTAEDTERVRGSLEESRAVDGPEY